jgi:Coenzyme PQQ synthesis protein D (PqqD)
VPDGLEKLQRIADQPVDMSTLRIGPPLPHILEEEVADELLIYDPSQKTFVTLNSTAADVWRLATGEFTLDGIVTVLANAYGTSEGLIRQQVEETVSRLGEVGLLRTPDS